MTNKLYDILKYVQRIVLPAVVVLLATVGKIINVDLTTVCAIISAVDVFLASILQIEYNNYAKGDNKNE